MNSLNQIQKALLLSINTKEDALRAIKYAYIIIYILAFLGLVKNIGNISSQSILESASFLAFSIMLFILAFLLHKKHSSLVGIIFIFFTLASIVPALLLEDLFAFLLFFSLVLTAFWSTKGTSFLNKINKVEQTTNR